MRLIQRHLGPAAQAQAGRQDADPVPRPLLGTPMFRLGLVAAAQAEGAVSWSAAPS